ncbi:unnamed protein product [Protopolystoma xenopodis]|uniref:Uncharacterized protein n=1 Tax=Protopolystoma xenopodis TaxID=117903 RepID=A0A3S5CM41_9PLAT|nr:unnamed protein product [Protopolystoma xenopodis]
MIMSNCSSMSEVNDTSSPRRARKLAGCGCSPAHFVNAHLNFRPDQPAGPWSRSDISIGVSGTRGFLHFFPLWREPTAHSIALWPLTNLRIVLVMRLHKVWVTRFESRSACASSLRRPRHSVLSLQHRSRSKRGSQSRRFPIQYLV